MTSTLFREKTVYLIFFSALIQFLTLIQPKAEELKSYDIINGLARPAGIPKTIDKNASSFDPKFLIGGKDDDFIRTLPAENLSETQRTELNLYIIQQDLPRIDIDINFAFASDKPLSSSMAIIEIISNALKSPQLAGNRFLVAGHTDTVGSASSNLTLSNKRAAAVRQILISKYHIDPRRLVAVGFGFDRLKIERDPLSSQNRRVEIVNLGPI